MRALVLCIFQAMPQICNVAIFLVFFLTIFALFGVAFFNLQLRHACGTYDYETGAWEPTDDTCDAGCSFDPNTMELLGCTSLGANTSQNYSWPSPWRPWHCSSSRAALARCRRRGPARRADSRQRRHWLPLPSRG